MPLCGCIFSAVDRRAEDHFVNQGNGTLKGLELRCDQTTNVPEDCSCPSGTSETASSKDGQHDNGSCASNNGHASETQQNGDFESQRESKGTEEIRTNLKEGGDKHGRYILGVAVCILGAVTSSLLQFVFVYGEVCFRALNKNNRWVSISGKGVRILRRVHVCLPQFVSLMMLVRLRRSGCRRVSQMVLLFLLVCQQGCAELSIFPKKARGLLSSVAMI